MISHPRAITDLPFVVLPESYLSSPGPVLARLALEHGPMFLTSGPSGIPELHCVGPEANAIFLGKEQRNFMHEEGWKRAERSTSLFGKGLTFLDGNLHQSHRAILSPALTPKSVELSLPAILSLLEARMDTWRGKQWVDIYVEAHRLTFDISAQVLLGMENQSQRDAYRELYLQLFWLHIQAESTVPIPQRSAWLREQSERIHHCIKDLLLPLIGSGRACPREHALGRMCAADTEKGFSDDAIIEEANSLMLAGHITTSSLLAWLTYRLLKSPRMMESALAEQQELDITQGIADGEQLRRMTFLDNALRETERMHPPIASLPRIAADNFELLGCAIPQGTFLSCSIAGAHYLKTSFRRPERFDPQRFAPPREEHLRTPFSLIGFSGGPRTCLGISLARTEIKAAITAILNRWEIQLVPGQNVLQIYRPMSAPMDGIKIQVKERNP